MPECIVAASYDPITKGHIDIIDRALNTFDKVSVCVGINPKKKYTFSLEEREGLTKKVLSQYGDRVIVKSYSGLLADFAYENQIKTIIRGARNSADFDFEKLLADINHGFNMGLETYVMFADQKLSHISSSAVKELQEHQAKTVIDYVPMPVKEALEVKISKQYRIGITGGIGCGKSYVETKLKELHERKLAGLLPEIKDAYIKIHCIDMDKIGRYILKESDEPIHYIVRKNVADSLGSFLMDGNKIDIQKLLKLLFDGNGVNKYRKSFEDIMGEPTMHLVRRQLRECKGIVLISSALFVESGICDLVNNNFIFVTCPEDVRVARLKKRGYTDQEIESRLSAQLTPEAKLGNIKDLIEKQNCGSVIEFNNLDNNASMMKNLYDQVIARWSYKI